MVGRFIVVMNFELPPIEEGGYYASKRCGD
jgi:hypothetical protein